MRKASCKRCLQPQMMPLFITQPTEIQKQTMHVQTRPGPHKAEEKHVSAGHCVTSLHLQAPKESRTGEGKSKEVAQQHVQQLCCIFRS